VWSGREIAIDMAIYSHASWCPEPRIQNPHKQLPSAVRLRIFLHCHWFLNRFHRAMCINHNSVEDAPPSLLGKGAERGVAVLWVCVKQKSNHWNVGGYLPWRGCGFFRGSQTETAAVLAACLRFAFLRYVFFRSKVNWEEPSIFLTKISQF